MFGSDAKFESGTGWPSFFQAIPEAVELREDKSIPFFPRTEVLMSRLGHDCLGSPDAAPIFHVQNPKHKQRIRKKASEYIAQRKGQDRKHENAEINISGVTSD